MEHLNGECLNRRKRFHLRSTDGTIGNRGGPDPKLSYRTNDEKKNYNDLKARQNLRGKKTQNQPDVISQKGLEGEHIYYVKGGGGCMRI